MVEPSYAGEMAASIEFIVVDGYDRWCFCILSQDIRLLQTDGQSELSPYRPSSSWVWVQLFNCCVISKQHVPDENLAYLCIGSETGEVDGKHNSTTPMQRILSRPIHNFKMCNPSL